MSSTMPELDYRTTKDGSELAVFDPEREGQFIIAREYSHVEVRQ